MTAFDHFSECLGLEANMDKSMIVFAGIDQDTKKQLLNITAFKAGELPFTYLGVPVKPQRLTKTECQNLIERITKKISSWPN